MMEMSGKRLLQATLVVLALTSLEVRAGFADDAVAFKTHCSKCHQRASTLQRNLKGDTRQERAAILSKFLESHHVADPIDRTAVVEYLVGQTAP
jgi:hypothetical protein